MTPNAKLIKAGEAVEGDWQKKREGCDQFGFWLFEGFQNQSLRQQVRVIYFTFFGQ